MQALRIKFPKVEIPPRWDICPATDVRQKAVEGMISQIDALLVVGSEGSHNTRELIKIGEVNGLPSFRIDGPSEIQSSWFRVGVASLGITSGASVPEEYLEAVLNRFKKQRTPVIYLRQGGKEKQDAFRLPQRDINALKLRYAA
jgi:4-hydroxy-3-methylbut-2-enyl diphosphate reductase